MQPSLASGDIRGGFLIGYPLITARSPCGPVVDQFARSGCGRDPAPWSRPVRWPWAVPDSVRAAGVILWCPDSVRAAGVILWCHTVAPLSCIGFCLYFRATMTVGDRGPHCRVNSEDVNGCRGLRSGTTRQQQRPRGQREIRQGHRCSTCSAMRPPRY